jgi:hypothetical protein
MLSKKEWVKKYVVRWQGIKNCDTHTVEGGYLWVRNDDGSITGKSGRGARSRAEAIAKNYQLYVEAQANTGLQSDGATGWRKMDDGSMGAFDWSDITQEPPRS